jgi:hypothetical protein
MPGLSLQEISREQLEQLALQATRVDYRAEPIQIGEEMRIMVQIGAPLAGVTVTFVWTQDVARMISKALKDGVERAEVAIVKPQSAIASA